MNNNTRINFIDYINNTQYPYITNDNIIYQEIIKGPLSYLNYGDLSYNGLQIEEETLITEKYSSKKYYY